MGWPLKITWYAKGIFKEYSAKPINNCLQGPSKSLTGQEEALSPDLLILCTIQRLWEGAALEAYLKSCPYRLLKHLNSMHISLNNMHACKAT